MSTLEKLLVLGVLVLVGVILAISLFWTREPGIVVPGGDPIVNTMRESSTVANPLPPSLTPPVANPSKETPSVADGSSASRPSNQGVVPIMTTAPQPIPAVPNALVRPSGNKDLWVYQVRAGDTPQTVSSKLTGSPASAHKIWVANESKPLVPGTNIFIPNEVFANAKPASDGVGSGAPSNDLAASPAPKSISTGLNAAAPATPKPAAAPSLSKNEKKPAATDSADGDRTYKVKQGDTLRAIARAQLKDERRWKEIVELNHITGEVIRAGQTIKLPLSK